MKKLQKKVVIATTVGLASMILNAACGYGPPVEYSTTDSSSNYGVSTTVDTEDEVETDTQDASDEATTAESTDKDNVPVVSPVYGPPPAGR